MEMEYSPGRWPTGSSKAELDPTRCKASVREQGMWPRFYQCKRKATLDGWCKQHHPDAQAARDKAAMDKHHAGQRKRAMGYYGETFMAALIKIRDGDNDPRQTAAAALAGCKYTPTITNKE